ncbi:hypothetical protein Zmor_000476 [Zophobas morio]|uniref:V-type proton ATPase subunit a n=1 Tax=Zophobas morio TaxID=2755281 RepID=A0AA38J4U4_9CUCU|nr:hypothetical protein Zmor_000476 [Zophobas morio]
MGNMLRSERMSLCQIFIPSEAAYYVISELGEIGAVQFLDLNKDVTSFQRNFVDDVRRCHEMERKLRYIESELENHGVTISPCSENVKALPPNEIADLERNISRSEEELKKLTLNAYSLKQCSLELLELKQVLEKAEAFLRKRDEIFGYDLSRNVGEDQSSTIINQFNFVTGIINREKMKSFETMLWRVCKGNVFFEKVEIENPLEDLASDCRHYKSVFIVCFHGNLLTPRINKICEGFRARIYSCPSVPSERRKLLESICRRLADIKLVINQTYAYRENFLSRIAKDLRYWSTMVSKIKAIYHGLNLLNMDVTGKCFIGQCWVPFVYIPVVKKALGDGSRASGCPVFSFLYVVKTDEDPPTFNRTNKFTQCFQKLVDVYGVASYQEVNPALYSMVTFPLLFAVMFGDIGHAFILVLFATFLIINEKNFAAKKVASEVTTIFYEGRYLILLMGIFSLYTGFVYNEVFSKSMNIFGSSWDPVFNYSVVVAGDVSGLDPGHSYVGSPYFFGVDPIWSLANNRIAFLNSYKMKMSIIFGVLHMILGLCSNVVNFVYFRKYANILLVFVPQLTLLSCLFLWLVAMMFIKWIMYSPVSTDVKYGTSCAPSILISFINMLLIKETVPRPGCDPYFFQFQPKLHKMLLIVSIITIPLMIFGKPLYVLYSRKQHFHDKLDNKRFRDELSLKFYKSVEQELNVNEEAETVFDLFVLQVIYTIEYVLSTISHTASYLRLWALSLAHSELSDVLWKRVLCLGMKFGGYYGGIAVFASFFLWAFFTLMILVIMEGLSAFLHTLRLHWVEFMSKFYEGKGYPFEPFSFKEILEHPERTESEEDLEECDENDVKLFE